MWNTLRKDIKKKHKQHKLLTYSCLLYVFTHSYCSDARESAVWFRDSSKLTILMTLSCGDAWSPWCAPAD